MSGTGGSKNSDPYKLLEQRGIKPTLSSEERVAANAYGMVAKKGSNGSANNANRTASFDTPINTGTSRPNQQSAANSIYEQINPDGAVKSRGFYDEKGNTFNRQDFDHSHFVKSEQKYMQPHEHNYFYNENGQPAGKSDGPLKPGYDNKQTN